MVCIASLGNSPQYGNVGSFLTVHVMDSYALRDCSLCDHSEYHCSIIHCRGWRVVVV